MGLSGVLVSLALCWASNGCDPPPTYYNGLTDALRHHHQTTAWPAVTDQVLVWQRLVETYFPASEVDRALCIIGYESRGNPDAKNPSSTAAGLFQFLRTTWNSVPTSVTGDSYDSGQVYDPEANVRAAAWLQGKYGWTQWAPYNNRGLCR
jgi:hypothetical protein